MRIIFSVIFAAFKGWFYDVFHRSSMPKMTGDFQIFSTRIIWLELGMPQQLLHDMAVHYFGCEKIRKDAKLSKTLLMQITNEIQERMVRRFAEEDSSLTLIKLFKILDDTYRVYLREKEQRFHLAELRVSDASISDTFIKNRNISRNIIDALYIWIENCIIHQNIDPKLQMDKEKNGLDYELMVDMYFYGLSSQALSLLALSENNPAAGFDGLDIFLDNEIVAQVHKEHPMIFYNPLIAGNQHVLDPEPNYANADSTAFGAGFLSVYGMNFRQFMAAILYFKKYILNDGKLALIAMPQAEFDSQVAHATKPPLNPDLLTRHFVLTQESLRTQLRKDEPIIWVMGTNKTRLELCPFVKLNNNSVMISYCALDQSMQLWSSLFRNGGMSYTNEKDALTEAFNQKNNELSEILVQLIREKLQNHYSTDFYEVNVPYDKIFGKKSENYGDYDLIFYSRKNNELFLIEAKYFSDSLTSSGLVTDFSKLFAEGRYYDHCRGRYDLVLAEPEKLKAFVASNPIVDVHFLFVTSKPLEIEIQDKDGVVTFLSLGAFDNYLEGRLINSDNECVVRPTRKL